MTRFLSTLLCLVSATLIYGQSLSSSTRWHWEEGTIVPETPTRPAGQQDALGMTAKPLSEVRVAFVGLGMRGADAVSRWTYIPGVRIVALCDYDMQRAEACQETLRKADFPPAALYSGEEGYKALCERSDIDLVYIATDWCHHVPVALCAMGHGKHAAIEVPAAMNLDQCWALINASEQTRCHCIMLENCCYDWYEMTALNIKQHGILGEIIRAEGAYIHNLDPYWEAYWKDPREKEQLGWRLSYNRDNRGDIYATHGLGPVAQALDLHRGDRITTLVAMDTKSVHGKALVEQKTGAPCTNFRNGDHTTTLMRTAEGKVIEIQHNTMSPQPYNRLYKLIGSKGYATKYPEPHYSLSADDLKAAGISPKSDDLSGHEFMPEAEQRALEAAYEHPILQKYKTDARQVGGHGGMDYIMDSRLVYCLRAGLPLDIDVYDLAEWCALAELGALSMDHNSASVAFPDFTRGCWERQKGFRHAYLSAAEEAKLDASAAAATAKMKAEVVKQHLWEKYDKAHR